MGWVWSPLAWEEGPLTLPRSPSVDKGECGAEGEGRPAVGKTDHGPSQVFASYFIFIIIFLATPCVTRDLSSLDQVSNLCPLQWKHGVLTVGRPGKSRSLHFKQLGIFLEFMI